MATILDSFLVTLGLDNKEFKKGANEVTEGIQQVAEKAAALFAILAGGMELKEFIHSTMEAEIATLRLSNKIGLNIEELQKWQGAAVLSGGSAEGFNSALNAMGGMLVDIEKKLPRAQRALTVLKAAGIEGLALGKKSDVLEVKDQLSEKMQHMGGMEATRLGSRMGLDDATIRLLRKGKEGIAELRNEAASLGLYTKEDAEASLQLEEAQKRLELSGAAVGRQIMTLLMPALKWMADQFLVLSKWAASHADVVRSAFIGIAAAATVAAVAVAAASWEFVLIAAAITAVVAGVAYLVMQYQKWDAAGGETATRMGKLFAMIKAGWQSVSAIVTLLMEKWWGVISTYVNMMIDEFAFIFALMSGDPDKIADAWKTMTDDMGKFVKAFADLALTEFYMLVFSAVALFDRLTDSVDASIDRMTNKLGPLKYLLKGAFAMVTGKAQGAAWDYMSEGVGSMMPSRNASQMVGAAGGAYRTWAGNSPLPSNSTSTSATTIGTLNVYSAASDAPGIAQDIRGHLVAQANGM